MIRLNNVSVTFDIGSKKLKLFSNLSLTVKGSEVFCLFGYSGIGKTTILNLIAGLLTPSGGQISIDSRAIKGGDNRIGYVFQEHRLFPWLNVLDNVMIAMETRVPNYHHRKRGALKSLRRTGAEGLSERYPDNLSGGEKQRVAIARAIAIEPNILLMDEPFSHLDELTVYQLRNMFARLTGSLKATTVYVTHNPFEAVYLADRIIVLKKKAVSEVSKVINNQRRNFFCRYSYEEFVSRKEVGKMVKELLASI